MLVFELIRPSNSSTLFINVLTDKGNDAALIDSNEVKVVGDDAIGLNVFDKQAPSLAVIGELPRIGLEVMLVNIPSDNLHVEPFSFGLFRYGYYDRLGGKYEAASHHLHNSKYC